jgi:hypothetical protein
MKGGGVSHGEAGVLSSLENVNMKQLVCLANANRRGKRQTTAGTEGPPQKKSTDPPAHLLNPRPTHPPPDLFSLAFFFSTFLGVSRQAARGVQNTPQKCIGKKSVSKTFPKISTKISMSDVSFFSTFLVSSHFRVFFSKPDFIRIPSPGRGQKRGRELRSARQLRGK